MIKRKLRRHKDNLKKSSIFDVPLYTKNNRFQGQKI